MNSRISKSVIEINKMLFVVCRRSSFKGGKQALYCYVTASGEVDCYFRASSHFPG